ncbi:hypothetical protein VPHK479_0053 [Vibrio phage K479]
MRGFLFYMAASLPPVKQTILLFIPIRRIYYVR